MNKFKIGQRVRIKPHSEIKNRIGISFNTKMKKFCGTYHNVRHYTDGGHLSLDCLWKWHEDWLESTLDAHDIKAKGYKI
jgi:hypothetical protein